MSYEKLELAVHTLCPYSQRALYVASFKSLKFDLVEVDLSNPSKWFLEINPLCEAPALKVTRNGQIYKLTESLNISEYLNSLPGRSLYPIYYGKIDSLEKGIIDIFIKNHLNTAGSYLYNFFYNKSATKEQTEEFRNYLNILNIMTENGYYFLHKTLYRNEMTMADVMIYPIIERYFAYKDFYQGLFEPYTHLLSWYNHMSSESWIQTYKAPINRLQKVYHIRREPGDYKPLVLPSSLYD
ncbi:hypothetical protein SteCoe_34932 [Stentor coeruleus]|uniref:GST N-terminal domain-containing protein n=1 Tax=Stentor coeruleus TaxID=5963 RepID=A0A1R2ATT1_9CILI|nr:hypothetical protein SteCoe_34932 [Stentor coeruleus]